MLGQSSTQSNMSVRSNRIEFVPAKPTAQAQLAEALQDLCQLLEEYAPSWYTEEHREKAQAALHRAQK